VVPRHDGRWTIAVPQQHTADQNFEQSGAALHPALIKTLFAIDEEKRRMANTCFLEKEKKEELLCFIFVFEV